MVLAMLAVSEMAARYRYRYDVEWVRDPDHRLPANVFGDTNADGIRSDREAVEFKEGDVNVIVLGDSFVYGLGEYRELAFPQQYERLARARHPECRINVANFGWVSSSPYLSLRLLKDIGKKYRPSVVVLGVDMTDFHDDVVFKYLIEKPTMVYKGLEYAPGLIIAMKKGLERFRRSEWAQHLHEEIFGFPLDRFYIVNAPLAYSERYASPLFASIRNIAEFTTDELQAKFVVLVFPRSFQYSDKESPRNWERGSYEVLGPHVLEPFVLFERLKQQVSFPVYSLLHDFQTTEVFPTVQHSDPHWTEKGNRFVAERLSDISAENDFFLCGERR
jgi:hypothetical protein